MLTEQQIADALALAREVIEKSTGAVPLPYRTYWHVHNSGTSTAGYGGLIVSDERDGEWMAPAVEYIPIDNRAGGDNGSNRSDVAHTTGYLVIAANAGPVLADTVKQLIAERAELLASRERLAEELLAAPRAGIPLWRCQEIACHACGQEEPWIEEDAARNLWHAPDCTWAAARRESRELLGKETTNDYR